MINIGMGWGRGTILWGRGGDGDGTCGDRWGRRQDLRGEVGMGTISIPMQVSNPRWQL